MKHSLGSWITIGHPAIAEIMADSGFDWLCVDMEHSVIAVSYTHLTLPTNREV